MYLIDTSVWIDFFRDKVTPSVNYFLSILDDEIPFGITSIIYQEILQGASTKKDFTTLQKYLSTQDFFYPKDEIKSYESAATIYFNARRKGITIRSTIDCLIAQITIENKLTLLQNDKDYNHIKEIIPSLKLAP